MRARVYSRAPISAELLGSLVETIAKIGFGSDPGVARDVFGRTYEYFIKKCAEGHNRMATADLLIFGQAAPDRR